MNVDDYNPSWQEDGQGIGDTGGGPNFEDDTQWDTNAWSDDSQAREDFINGPDNACTPPGSPDTSKIYIKATHFVDDAWACFWLETTDCP